METLAFLHAAAAYEDPNLPCEIRAFDIPIETVKSIVVSFVTSGIVMATATQANAVQTIFNYGDTGSGVAALQSALGDIEVDGIFGTETLAQLKAYQAAHRLAVDGVAGPKTLASLRLVGLAEAPDIEQYGTVKLINDTPYEVIIFMYEPGQEDYFRYAYLPPCSERMLQSTYSNLWQFSLNDQEKHPITINKNWNGNFFEIKASSLNEIKGISSCEQQQLQSSEGQVTGSLVYAEDVALIQPGILDELGSIVMKLERANRGTLKFQALSADALIKAYVARDKILKNFFRSLAKNAPPEDVERITRQVRSYLDEINTTNSGKLEEVIEKLKKYLKDCYPDLKSSDIEGIIQGVRRVDQIQTLARIDGLGQPLPGSSVAQLTGNIVSAAVGNASFFTSCLTRFNPSVTVPQKL